MPPYDVDPGNEPGAVHVPYQPTTPAYVPEIRPDDDESEQSLPDEPDNPQHVPTSGNEPSDAPAYDVDPGNEPGTVHVPYQPPAPAVVPEIRPDDEGDRPLPDEPDDPQHAPENESPAIGEGQEEEAPSPY